MPRPLPVLIIGALFIGAGAAGIVYHLTDPFGAEQAWVLLLRFLAIVGGVFVLRGANWARWLLVAWMGYHAILSLSHSVPGLLIHGTILATVAFVLFRPHVSPYFQNPVPNIVTPTDDLKGTRE